MVVVIKLVDQPCELALTFEALVKPASHDDRDGGVNLEAKLTYVGPLMM